jgi:hypothetical protein
MQPKVKWRRVAFWATLFLFIYTWPTEGDFQPITLQLQVGVCLAPCEQKAKVLIPRHPDNRWAAIVWEYGSHEWSIEGENAPVEHPPITIRFTEPGEYVVYAVLLRQKGARRESFQDSKPLIVM